MPSAAYRRRRRRARPTSISWRATQLAEQLIADIADGFYVTDLIGMGVNPVTGDYSRGAAGFWIENGELTYPVSEVTIAGHLTDMFRTLEPANDLTFRYGTNAPTVRAGGHDRCRPLSRIIDRRRSAAGLPRPCAKPARFALQKFRSPLKSWTKGTAIRRSAKSTSRSMSCCASG